MSNKAGVRDFQNSLLSWISDHLGEKSYMADEVTQLPSSPRENPSNPEGSPSVVLAFQIEKETKIRTQGDLDCLKESFSFPLNIQIRLPEADDTIVSAYPSEVAFYKAAFHVGLRLPMHPIIRRILYYYNICPAQLVPNAWRSLV